MKIAGWIAFKLSRVCLFIGGIAGLGLIVATIAFVFGTRQFPLPFDSNDGSYWAYLWQVGAMAVGAWILWQVCTAITLRALDTRSYELDGERV